MAAIGRHRGHIAGIEVTLSHPGTHHILGLRMAELANGFPALGEVLAHDGDLLVEQLAGRPTRLRARPAPRTGDQRAAGLT